MNKYINTSYQIAFSLFCGVIPFTDLAQAVPNIGVIVLTLFFPFVVKKEDWRRIRKPSFYILLFLVLITIIQTGLFVRWEDFEFIGRFFLLVIIIVYSIPVKNKFAPMFSFVLGSLFLLVLSSIKLTSFFLKHGMIDMTTGEQIALVLLGERPYVAYVYVLSFCLCIYLSTQFFKKRFLFYTAALLFFVFVFVISARVSLISLLILILLYVFYSKNIKKLGIIISVLGLFCALMILSNDSLKKRFFISKNTYTFEQLIKFEPRYYIWNCGYDIFFQNNNYFAGEGFVNINNQLEVCYSERSDFMDEEQQDYFIRRKFNTHNQFLNFILSAGVFCFISFISFFIVWILMDYRNYYVCILIFSILLFCLVENVFSRQMGIELFALTFVFSNMISLNYDKND